MDSICFVSSTCYSASAITYSSSSIYTQSEVYTEIRVGRDKSDVKLIATWNQWINPVKNFFIWQWRHNTWQYYWFCIVNIGSFRLNSIRGNDTLFTRGWWRQCAADPLTANLTFRLEFVNCIISFQQVKIEKRSHHYCVICVTLDTEQ